MKAILIDPHDETVSTVQYDGNYQSIYKLIGCDTFDVVSLDDTNSLYIDDEGLFRPDQKFFWAKGWPHPLAGKALILGTTEDGDSAETDLSSHTVAAQLHFMTREQVARGLALGIFE